MYSLAFQYGIAAGACEAERHCICRPIINVCDRFDMVGDLTNYLYSNNMLRYIEGYVQKVNPSKAPMVVGALLDLEAPDDFVTNLILSVRSLIPVEQLVEEVEKRNRLKLLNPFLEHLVSEGSKVGDQWQWAPMGGHGG